MHYQSADPLPRRPGLASQVENVGPPPVERRLVSRRGRSDGAVLTADPPLGDQLSVFEEQTGRHRDGEVWLDRTETDLHAVHPGRLSDEPDAGGGLHRQ